MTNTRGAEVRGGTFVLAERALLLGENPGDDVAVAGERVELDPVDGGGLERPRAMARRHAQRSRRSPTPALLLLVVVDGAVAVAGAAARV